MDTSKDYYESVMRDFKTYVRGRIPEQYCRDEAVDYKQIEKAKEMYGAPAKGKGVKPERKTKSKTTDIITRAQLMLLLTGAVTRTIRIN